MAIVEQDIQAEGVVRLELQAGDDNVHQAIISEISSRWISLVIALASFTWSIDLRSP